MNHSLIWTTSGTAVPQRRSRLRLVRTPRQRSWLISIFSHACKINLKPIKGVCGRPTKTQYVNDCHMHAHMLHPSCMTLNINRPLTHLCEGNNLCLGCKLLIIMLKSLPIILFLYSQKLCPLFFSKLPIILKLFSINNVHVINLFCSYTTTNIPLSWISLPKLILV